MGEMITKLIIAIIIIVFLTFIFSWFIGYKMTKPKRLKIKSNPKEKLGVDYENIEFKSGKNTIKGWYIPSEENRFTVVYSHGYLENRESFTIDIYRVIEEMRSLGGNVLCFDFSGSGESDGPCVTCGYREKKDLMKAIDFAKTKSNAPIIIYGISMGAATTALVTSERDDIAAAICDSPFSNLKEYLSMNLGVWTHLPKFPFQPIIFKAMEKTSGLSLDKVVPAESVKNSKVPILIMHGKGDHLIPYTESVKLKKLNPDMVTLDIIENDDHCKSLEKQRDRYMENISNFIDKVLEDKKK